MTPASSACVEERRCSAAMVEAQAGCLFEDIQYEDIQVEAVNLLTNNNSVQDINGSSAVLGENSPGGV